MKKLTLMKLIYFFLLLFTSSSISLADINAREIVIRGDNRIVAKKGDSSASFSADKGSVLIDFKTGTVEVKETDVTTAAKAFWEMLALKFHELTPVTEKLRISYIQFTAEKGVIKINVKTGAVTWPGVADMKADSRAFWDAVVVNSTKK